jgi:hypothetical protein
MFGRNEISDKELTKTVNSRLARTGTGSRIIAIVNRGVATLSGKLQYAGQRTPIVNTASRIAGIRQVVDNMQITPAKKQISPPPKPMAKPAPPVEIAAEVPPPNIAPVQPGESLSENKS